MSKVDILLQQKYKEMVGFSNIINKDTNTIINTNTTIIGNLLIDNETLLNKNLNVNNAYVNGNITFKDCNINTIYSSSLSTIEKLQLNNITTTTKIITDIIDVNDCMDVNNININNITCNNNVDIIDILTVDTIKNTDNIININGKNINFGDDNTNININGNINYLKLNKTQIENKHINLNNSILNPSTTNAGIKILSTIGTNEAYIKTNSDNTNFIIKTPIDTEYKTILQSDKDHNIKLLEDVNIKNNVTINNILESFNIMSNNLLVNGNLDLKENMIITENLNNYSKVNILNYLYSNDIIVNNYFTNKSRFYCDNLYGKKKLYINGISNIQNMINLDLNVKNDLINSNNIICNMYLTTNNIFSNNINVKNNVNVMTDLNILFNENYVTGNLNGSQNTFISNDINLNNCNVINDINFNNGNVVIGNSSNDDNIINLNDKHVILPLKDFQTNSEASIDIPLWGFYRTGGIVKIRLDVQPPIITIDNPEVSIKVNTIYIDSGVTVTDNIDEYEIIVYINSIKNDTIDNIITAPIPITNPNTPIPETSTLPIGEYTIEYYAHDNINNVTTKTRKLIVNIS